MTKTIEGWSKSQVFINEHMKVELRKPTKEALKAESGIQSNSLRSTPLCLAVKAVFS